MQQWYSSLQIFKPQVCPQHLSQLSRIVSPTCIRVSTSVCTCCPLYRQRADINRRRPRLTGGGRQHVASFYAFPSLCMLRHASVRWGGHAVVSHTLNFLMALGLTYGVCVCVGCLIMFFTTTIIDTATLVFIQTLGRCADQGRIIQRNDAVIQRLVDQADTAKATRQSQESKLDLLIKQLGAMLEQDQRPGVDETVRWHLNMRVCRGVCPLYVRVCICTCVLSGRGGPNVWSHHGAVSLFSSVSILQFNDAFFYFCLFFGLPSHAVRCTYPNNVPRFVTYPCYMIRRRF